MRVMFLALGGLLLIFALLLVFAEWEWAIPVGIVGTLCVLGACVRLIPASRSLVATLWNGDVELYHGPLAWLWPVYVRSDRLFWEGPRIAPVETQGLTMHHVPINVKASVIYAVHLDAIADPSLRILAAGWLDATWRQTIEAIFDALVKATMPQMDVSPPNYVCDRIQLMMEIEPLLRLSGIAA